MSVYETIDLHTCTGVLIVILVGSSKMTCGLRVDAVAAELLERCRLCAVSQSLKVEFVCPNVHVAMVGVHAKAECCAWFDLP